MIVSIVIPAYNEEKRLPLTLEILCRYMDGRGSPYEVIVVDDGSQDATSRVAQEAASRGLPVSVSRLEQNSGKGAAVARGFESARGDWILFVDSDLGVGLDAVTALLDLMSPNVEVLVGSKYCAGARVQKAPPLPRVLASWTFRTLTRMFLRLSVSDTQCGLKAFRGDVARRVFSRRTVDGFAFDAELLVIARRQGQHVREVPVNWSYLSGTTVRFFGSGIRAFGDIMRIWWQDLRGNYR